MTYYKPEVSHDDCYLTVGRGRLAVRGALCEKIMKKTKLVHTTIHSRLMEQIIVAVNHDEPVLLVGETGTGKTSAIQYCAAWSGAKLRVVNMSRQSEGADLLGSFRPVDAQSLLRPIFGQFHSLMNETFPGKNEMFLTKMGSALATGQIKDVVIPAMKNIISQMSPPGDVGLAKSWNKFSSIVNDAEIRIKSQSLSFAFVEGELAQAVRNGDWLLLDELNLAPAELLESISGLLDSGFLAIPELGLIEPHKSFRLFAAMNPANDFAKKDLPDSLRGRFSEFYVAEANSEFDISRIVFHYLPSISEKIQKRLVQFYLKVRKEKIRDISGKNSTFSLRTLARALQVARDSFGHSPTGIFQSLQLAFMSGLDESSSILVSALLRKYEFVAKNKEIKLLSPSFDHVTIEGFHFRSGQNSAFLDEKFIITKTVRQNLFNLSRAISASKYPILIQG